MTDRSRALADLFHAFGLTSVDQLEAFDRAISDKATCETCYVITCKELAQTAQRKPTPAQFLGANIDVFRREHHRHVGLSVREESASRVEVFWRKDAPTIIKALLECEREAALRVAARIWYSGTVTPDVSALRTELKSTDVWAFEASCPQSRDLTEHFFTGARRNHSLPVAMWPEPEWDAYCAEESTLIAAAKASA